MRVNVFTGQVEDDRVIHSGVQELEDELALELIRLERAEPMPPRRPRPPAAVETAALPAAARQTVAGRTPKRPAKPKP